MASCPAASDAVVDWAVFVPSTAVASQPDGTASIADEARRRLHEVAQRLCVCCSHEPRAACPPNVGAGEQVGIHVARSGGGVTRDAGGQTAVSSGGTTARNGSRRAASSHRASAASCLLLSSGTRWSCRCCHGRRIFERRRRERHGRRALNRRVRHEQKRLVRRVVDEIHGVLQRACSPAHQAACQREQPIARPRNASSAGHQGSPG